MQFCILVCVLDITVLRFSRVYGFFLSLFLPTGIFTTSEPQHQEINKFCEVQERRAMD